VDVYAYFVYIWMMTSYPGSRKIHQVFLDSRLQYESLEGLMDFLAFLFKSYGKTSKKQLGGSPLIP